ncbi:MAG: phosphotransferase [Candidatus Limnocylindria bacterium]
MRTIELAGPIGGGKSAAELPLREVLRDRGVDVLTMAEARRLAGIGRRRRAAAAVEFAAGHPRLVAIIARSLIRAPIAWWHRRHIFGLVLRLGAELDLLDEALPSATWVIVDEGWLHRSVNVFAWREPMPSLTEITAYLDRAPISPQVVLIEAPEAMATVRLNARGLPKRLRGRSADEVEQFVRRSRDVLVQAATALESGPHASDLVRVCNDGSTDDLRARLGDAVGAWDPIPASPIHRQTWPSLPRPDRAIQRISRRSRAVAIDAHELAAAAEHFRLPSPIRTAPPASPGGRGRVAVLHDGASGSWLLKRYKPSLGDEEIGSEHAILARLTELRRSTPRLRVGADGTTLLHASGGRMALFELAKGYVHPHERLLAPRDRRRMEIDAGATLAGLHEALANFTPPFASPNGFEALGGPRVVGVERTRALIDGARASDAAAALPGSRIEAELQRLDVLLERADLPRTVIHGDYGPYNLLVRNGHPPFVLDFELARTDWRLTDLAGALPRFAQRRLGFDEGAAGRFLEGYRSVSHLPSDELRLLPSVAQFLGLRRAVVCWDRFRATGDRAWLTVARERYAFTQRVAAGRHPINGVV